MHEPVHHTILLCEHFEINFWEQNYWLKMGSHALLQPSVFLHNWYTNLSLINLYGMSTMLDSSWLNYFAAFQNVQLDPWKVQMA